MYVCVCVCKCVQYNTEIQIYYCGKYIKAFNFMSMMDHSFVVNFNEREQYH